jgi:hypothetical protein
LFPRRLDLGLDLSAVSQSGVALPVGKECGEFLKILDGSVIELVSGAG